VNGDGSYVPLGELHLESMQLGSAVVTDGLYAGRIENTFALSGSSVLFVIDPESGVKVNVRFTDLDSKSGLIVKGVTAYKDSTKTHYVNVVEVNRAPDLHERVLIAINDPAATPESLIRVGSQARAWGREHRDDRLVAAADAAFFKALKMEDSAVKPGDYEGYFRIAEKAGQLIESPSVREFYVREGIDVFIQARGPKSPETYYEAAKRAAGLLPSGVLSAQLLEEGFAIERGGRETKTAASYYALAAKARELFGQDLTYRVVLGKALDAERQSLPQGDYTALYAFARKVKDVYPAYAGYRSAVLEAVSAEKAAMDTHDSQAWFRLGNRLLYFLDDLYQAGMCFKESARLDPANSEAREKLRELGYVYYQGDWWRAGDFGKSDMFRKARELEDLAAEGKVAVGMTRDQLIRAKGAPQEVNVSAGGWGVTTQWVYTSETGRLYVDLIADTVVSKGETTD